MGLSFSWQFCFPSCILKLSFQVHIHLGFFWWTDPFIIVKWPSLSKEIFFALKSALCNMNIATPAFFWLVFARYIFTQPFTFNLFMTIYLKWGSCKQYVVGSYFLKKKKNPISESIPFNWGVWTILYLMWLLIWLSLNLLFATYILCVLSVFVLNFLFFEFSNVFYYFILS